MKEIKAIIRPAKLDALRETLRQVPGFPGMTVSKAEGISAPERLAGSRHSIRDELTDYTPKVRIEMVVPDELADTLVERIVSVAATGQVGDGLVWVTDVSRAVFIHKVMPGAEAAQNYPK